MTWDEKRWYGEEGNSPEPVKKAPPKYDERMGEVNGTRCLQGYENST